MSFRYSPRKALKTEPVRVLLKEKKAFTKYDEQLFLRTSFHLKPQNSSEAKLKISTV